jgi:hypothetical protein
MELGVLGVVAGSIAVLTVTAIYFWFRCNKSQESEAG